MAAIPACVLGKHLSCLAWDFPAPLMLLLPPDHLPANPMWAFRSTK